MVFYFIIEETFEDRYNYGNNFLPFKKFFIERNLRILGIIRAKIKFEINLFDKK